MKVRTKIDRYADVSERCGLSMDIVRDVIKALKESVESDLASGTEASIPGMVIFTPELRGKLIGSRCVESVGAKTRISPSFELQLAKHMGYSESKPVNEDADRGTIKSSEGANVPLYSIESLI